MRSVLYIHGHYSPLPFLTCTHAELPAALVGQTLVPLPHGFMAFSGV